MMGKLLLSLFVSKKGSKKVDNFKSWAELQCQSSWLTQKAKMKVIYNTLVTSVQKCKQEAKLAKGLPVPLFHFFPSQWQLSRVRRIAHC